MDDKKPITVEMAYRVGRSDDHATVIVEFGAPVSQIQLSPHEARRLSGMLRRMAAGCSVEKRHPAPPPIRVKEWENA